MKTLTIVLALLAIACNDDASAAGGARAASGAAPAAPAAGDVEFAISTDPAVIAEGKELFASKTCSACHQMNAKVVGPPLAGVTDRRTPEWLAHMIMKPDQWVKTDPEAKKLYEEYKTPMPNVGVQPAEANAIIAYLASQR